LQTFGELGTLEARIVVLEGRRRCLDRNDTNLWGHRVVFDISSFHRARRMYLYISACCWKKMNNRRKWLAKPIIFLDLGGVILDKDQLTTQWQHLVGDCFVSLLGGTTLGWIESHQVVTKHLLELESVERSRNFVNFYWTHQLNWIKGLCERKGMCVPEPAECIDLAYRATTWISRHIQAALPGATQTIRFLHSHGYTMHIASGSCSIEVAGYLEGMGVRHCFGHLYGADLINVFKEGPQYYVSLFKDVGVRPRDSLVVDDSAEAINWAMQVGARTVRVSTSLCLKKDLMSCIKSLNELPAYLQQRS